MSGAITLGVFQLAFTNSWSLTWAIINLSRISNQLNEAKIKISRLIPIFEEVPYEFFGAQDWDINWKEMKIVDLNFDFEINGVTTPALHNINLVLEKGKKYGFVGHSGSGKSTLTKILVGLYESKSGQIQINNDNKSQSFYDIDSHQVHDNIGIVLQETELFDLSFRDNLTMLKEVSEDKVLQAIKIAQLEGVLGKLPNGLDTELGEKGYKLSGGEKQRLGIARAIINDAQIIIFDESTSALDTQTELLIQEAIESQLADKTLILVAHRLSTLKNVDKIFVFSAGRLIEEGKFGELIKDDKSYFYKLWNNQSSNSD